MRFFCAPLAFFLVLGGCGRLDSNLLTNDGFERGPCRMPGSWTAVSWRESPDAVVLCDETMRRSGRRSLLIRQTSANDSAVLQSARVEPGTHYRISGWIATRGVIHSQGALGATLGVYGSWAVGRSLAGEQGWTYSELWVKTAPAQRRLTVACRLGHHASVASGAAWFEDVSLVRFDAPPPSLARGRIVALPPGANYDVHPLLQRPSFLLPAVVLLLAALRWLLNACARGRLSDAWSAAAVFAVFVGIYGFSSRAIGRGPFTAESFPFAQSQFAHYVFLADALLHGRLDISQALYEVAVQGGKIYVMEPIFPALMMTPFVAVFGKGFYDVLFLVVLGACNVALMHGLWPKLERWIEGGLTLETRYWLTVLFGAGTAHWYLAAAGRVWHAEGIAALFCLLLAVHESLGRARPALVGAFLGWAFLSHPPTLWSLPFFQAVLDRRWERRQWLAAAAVLGLEIFLGWGLYNQRRFGSFFDAGLGQAFVSERYGLMSWRYIPHGFFVNFFRLPKLTPQFPYFSPMDAQGFSLFLATPAFLFIFRAFKKNALAFGCWAALAVVQLFLMLYHASGWTQFGHRRALDVMPFLMALTALGVGPQLGAGAKVLIIFSVWINFLGLFWYYGLH